MEIILATKFGSSCSKLLLLVCLLFGCVVDVSLGRTYIVGDNLGWQTPPNGVVTYSNWANQHTFVVGDILGEYTLLSAIHFTCHVFFSIYIF